MGMSDLSPDDLLFDVLTPLDFTVRVTYGYWKIITTIKHPSMSGREADIQKTLKYPDQVRQSKSDPQVYLFYRAEGKQRWVCAVSKRLNGDGFLITAYVTDAIKEGTQIWPK